ncbi:MAG: hypothetical protein JRE57_12755 [Deltaproteobacteria bacterium]|nr:hypothetical protein [Deltaproteobacteria bacterium]
MRSHKSRHQNSRSSSTPPGVTGHLNYFLLLTGISAVGVLVVLLLMWLLKDEAKQQKT